MSKPFRRCSNLDVLLDGSLLSRWSSVVGVTQGLAHSLSRPAHPAGLSFVLFASIVATPDPRQQVTSEFVMR
jgi:hypothetical protein